MIKNSIKKKIINIVFKNFKKDKNIISISFVGSFIENNELKKINDIDLIIIVNKLTEKTFRQIKKKIKNLKLEKFFLKKKIAINDTFGPLKFNTNKFSVIHLMIYDLKGHIDHTIKSPFTVYDWERSKIFLKQSLSSLYTAGNIQLVDFIKSRRGILNYLQDIKYNKITYRRYKFKKNNYETVKESICLKERDKFEFYFHIIKNLLLNYFKFISKKNKLFLLEKNDKNTKKYIGKSFYYEHKENINNIIKKKKNLDFKIKKNFDLWIIKFIKDFQKNIVNLEKNSKKIIFIRHAKTLKNDGSFLGQSRNPKIIKKKYNIKKISFSKIYTSPLIRCIETANILSSKKEYFVDKNLLEINYGELEGMNIYELNQKYPKLIQKWSKGQDPKFPKGESQKDVLKRIKMFINKIKKDKSKNICVISHNVFLRCLIGEYFQIPKQKWYKINIPHLMKLEFVVIKNNIYPNMDRKKFKIIFSNLY